MFSLRFVVRAIGVVANQKCLLSDEDTSTLIYFPCRAMYFILSDRPHIVSLLLQPIATIYLILVLFLPCVLACLDYLES